ncbi:MAG: 23S rRNA (adenine(1618)-N(6))-methyltransferase RlmF [Flavobacterium sp.]
MSTETNKPTIEKKSLHPRNKHLFGYDFAALIKTEPFLEKFVSKNKFGNESIDFSNPLAVKTLNKSLLLHHYDIVYWDIPKTNLCPPIPGRADYIHYIADLLSLSNKNLIPMGEDVRGLDIGVGANCIYPIIGHQEYGWKFVGTEVDKECLNIAQKILDGNTNLVESVKLRLQQNKRHIFKEIVEKGDKFDFVICNPPFHSSREEASKGSMRKLRNIGKQKSGKPVLNFGGQNNELWCEGGELAFITNMIYESAHFKTHCLWFTVLVSKKENLKPFYNHLKKVKAFDVKTIEMEQGNKVSRFIAWTFLDESQQKKWNQQKEMDA